MSLRWRSELLLELRMRGCHAHLLGPGWTRQSQASASAGGSGGCSCASAATTSSPLTPLPMAEAYGIASGAAAAAVSWAVNQTVVPLPTSLSTPMLSLSPM